MFTGIIESTGTIREIREIGTNRQFIIESSLSPELKVDQSLSHNGVCLTVENIDNQQYQVTAIEETLLKTSLGKWKAGQRVNLERCLQWNGRLDGHIVQGHVDSTGTCLASRQLDGSWEFTIGFPEQFASLVIEKGSISLNGISLTIFNVKKNQFTVAIIPYTFHHTNISELKEGDLVNLEFDMVGKYVNRHLQLQNH